MQHKAPLAWGLCAVLIRYAQSSLIPLTARDSSGGDLTDNHAYEAELWNTGGPIYQDVSQGTNGDCWLDAASAAVAYADQAQLMKTMVPNNDIEGTVNVTLFDGATPHLQKITKPDANTYRASESDAAENDGPFVWPAVMELAFQAFAKEDPSTGISPTLNGGTIASSLAAVYGSGDAITYYTISDTSDDDLWALWLNVGTKPTTSSTFGSNSDMNADGLPTGHAYSAIRCDRTKGIVTLRNPWGMVSQNSAGFSNNGGKGVTGRGDGVFDISFADWKTLYVDIAAVS